MPWRIQRRYGRGTMLEGERETLHLPKTASFGHTPKSRTGRGGRRLSKRIRRYAFFSFL